LFALWLLSSYAISLLSPLADVHQAAATTTTAAKPPCCLSSFLNRLFEAEPICVPWLVRVMVAAAAVLAEFQ